MLADTAARGERGDGAELRQTVPELAHRIHSNETILARIARRMARRGTLSSRQGF